MNELSGSRIKQKIRTCQPLSLNAQHPTKTLNPEWQPFSSSDDSYRSMIRLTAGEFTFQDFIPKLLKSDEITFESFSTLIEQANLFLKSNPSLEIKTCEMRNIIANDIFNIEVDATFYRRNYCKNYVLRSLRLWLIKRKSIKPCQQIAYVNFLPIKMDCGSYESLQQVLDRFNDENEKKTIPGQILAVDARKIFIGENDDPDISYWPECAQVPLFSSKKFIYILRVFYVVGSPIFEKIGIMDFIPRKLYYISRNAYHGDGNLIPVYESFESISNNAARWYSACSSQKIINAQTLDIPEHNQRTNWMENEESYRTDISYPKQDPYIRMLRLVYTISTIDTKKSHFPGIFALSCKTFIPYQLPGNVSYEKLENMMNRINDWIKLTGASVLNIESVPMRTIIGYMDQFPSCSYFDNDSDLKEGLVQVIRVCIDGNPSPGQYLAMDPDRLFQIEEDDSNCSIS